MVVLEVIPLSPSLPFETLSYYSKEDIEVGDLVTISIRRRNLYGLVTRVTPLRNEKQAIKNASFTLKKINGKSRRGFIDPTLARAIVHASSCSLVPQASLFYDLLPSKLFAQKELPNFPRVEETSSEMKRKDPIVLMQPKGERIIHYRRLIRESLAKKESICFFFPTIQDMTRMKEELGRGIEDYFFVYHSGVTQKEMQSVLKALTKESHAVVILSTPSVLPLLREDMASFVIEREHSLYYYTHGDKGYDMRSVLMHILTSLEKKIILDSHLISLNAYARVEEGSAELPVPLHVRNDTRIRLVPMNKDNYAATPYLSYASKALLERMKLEGKGHYFLYTHRKGMYPTTVCSDCSTLLTCDRCDTPFILHMISGIRTYVCHQCENVVQVSEESTINCKHCGGWRMRLLGIASQGVIESLIPLGVPLFVIDGESTPTKEKAKKVYAEWKASPYGVLVGTEMALNMIDTCDGVTIVSLDSLFSLPEYSIDEKIVSIVTEAQEKAGDEALILQTRMHDTPIFEYLTSHSFVQYYESILAVRKEAMLPPYYTIIKLLFTNLRDAKKKSIEEHLLGRELRWYEAGGGRTLLFVHVLQSEWEHDEKLRRSIAAIADERAHVNPPHLFS